DIQGGGLPGGVRIRESPTLQSLGKVAIQAQPDGTFKIDSFFDVFVDLSTDSGATWCPATNYHKVKLAYTNPPPTNLLPPTNGYYTNLNGILTFSNCPNYIITNIVHRGWTNSIPPPTNNIPTIHTFDSVVDGWISIDGGFSFNPFTASAQCTVK